jgi:rubrerythrin
MGADVQENELTDVVLCYQSLGLALDSSPTQIDQMYRSLTDENKKKLAAPDPALREEARKSQELVNEMYDKIRGSITYRAMERDYEKRAETAQASEVKVKRAVHQSVVEKRQMVNCPRCNGLIAKGLKTCPICKTRFLSLSEKIMKACFSRNMVILYCLVLAVAASLFVYFNFFAGPKAGMSEFETLEQKTPAK